MEPGGTDPPVVVLSDFGLVDGVLVEVIGLRKIAR